MKDTFPICNSLLSIEEQLRFSEIVGSCNDIEELPRLFKGRGSFAIPYLVDLARLEMAVDLLNSVDYLSSPQVSELTVNPAFYLVPVEWCGLAAIIKGHRVNPDPAPGFVMLWRPPVTGGLAVEQASAPELLALKVVVDELTAEQAAQIGGVTVGKIDAAIDLVVQQGIVLAPPSSIRRTGNEFLNKNLDNFIEAQVFTLQWHITQKCDLHCKHCYDRSDRTEMTFEQGAEILHDFRTFCRSRHVDGQVSFTGGNPLLYPHFTELYQLATDLNLGTAVLGNPAVVQKIDNLRAIQHPTFYQVSLEGLPIHNDKIRGAGHFDRIMDFLMILKERDIYSMVMLTLTSDNQDQVLPLAELLRDRVDLFTFNRLSMVGEGANLLGADTENYQQFLSSYLKAAKANPIMALKDNLINIIKDQQGLDLFGGCAGFGCGAAFNFVSVLPDGEVHACRKFPSPIGNLYNNTLAEIYDSELARRYRQGPTACRDCKIRPVCGGCLAVVHGLGMDPFVDLDPYCFMMNHAKDI